MYYVCGFAYADVARPTPAFTEVLLLRKFSPVWQKGKYNGVGGKIESGETIHVAMAREFVEETGVQTDARSWELFHVERFHNGDIVYFMHTTVHRHRILDAVRNTMGKVEPAVAIEVGARTGNVVNGNKILMYNIRYLLVMSRTLLTDPEARHRWPVFDHAFGANVRLTGG